jgi:hypothetical protein
MTDVLTHVFVGFIIGTALSFRFKWLRRPFVTVVMVGALLPDVAKISMVIPPETVESTFGVTFDWFGFHTPFGTTIVAGIGALLVSDIHRKRVFVLLLLGASSHYVLDSILMSPSRFAYTLLWPFRVQLIPLPMWILSSDRLPAMFTGGVALVLWLGQWWTSGSETSDPGGTSEFGGR